jgi:hypothetical protein
MKTVKKMGMGGMSDGSMMKDSMMKKGGAVKAASKKPKMAMGGSLKDVPASKTGLAKLPTEVRNKMGYKKNGGATVAKASMGGTAPKKGMGGAMKYKMGGSMKGKKC